MSAPPASKLDANQVLQASFDDASGSLRVNATITATVTDVEIVDADGDRLDINPDGSLNSNVTIDSTDGDSILAVGTVDGTTSGTQHVMKVGTDGTVQVAFSGDVNVTATDLDIRNLAFATDKVDVSGSTISSTITGTPNVNVTNAGGASAVNIQDGGNSITVDGSVTVTQATGTNLHTVVDSGTITTITNVVHVDDNGGSLTVDGTVSISGTVSENLAQVGGNTVTTGSGAAASGTQRVILATDQSVIPINDNGGSITVDGTVAATQSGTWDINNITGTISLPTGASTAANQATGNASLASIDTKLTSPLAVTGPLTDTQLRASPVPVTASITGTPNVNVTNGAGASAVNIQDGGNSITVDGSVTANAGTNLNTSALNLETTQSAINAKIPSGLTVTSTRLLTDGSGVTQPISAASLPLPTGASTSANQATGNASLASIDSKLTSPITVTGPLTDTQLRATPVPISGTVTANIGTTNGLALDATVANPQGSISGGTAGTKSDLAGGIYNTTPPTLTNGQQAALQFDVNGNLKTTATASGTVNENLIQVGSNTVTTGSGASAAGTQRVILATDQSVIPINDNGGSITVDGTIAATQSGAWTVTANAGTNLNTSALALESGGNLASIKTNTDNLNLSQASTTSGQSGPLMQGAVTTSSPTYTTGQTDPLSLTTSGDLRVSVGPRQGTLVDGSGACNSGAWKSVFAANTSRKYLFIQNIDTNGGYMFVGFGASPTTLNSIILGPLGSFCMESSYISTEQIQVYGITTTTDFCAKEGN